MDRLAPRVIFALEPVVQHLDDPLRVEHGVGAEERGERARVRRAPRQIGQVRVLRRPVALQHLAELGVARIDGLEGLGHSMILPRHLQTLGLLRSRFSISSSVMLRQGCGRDDTMIG